MLRKIFDNLDRHCGKHEHYFDVYERHFSKFIGKKPVVVEVGICRGGSAEMWQKYFGKDSRIIGIDIEESAFLEKHQTPGCEQVRGDQGDPKFWENFFLEHPDVDVFIDDGGHHQYQQINTLISVWPHMKLGSVYICEDTHTSYWPEYSGGGLKKTTSFIEYAKSLTDTVNSRWYKDQDRSPDNMAFADHYKDLSSIHFYDSMVVFEKEKKFESNLITSTPI
jgi:23S rRNA U2552 (ribose-2'-O)-methylase RlmE/FtsJ